MAIDRIIHRAPLSILGAAVALMVLGLVGIARSEELAGGAGRFVRHQAVWAVLAVGGMLAAAWPSYRWLCRLSYAIYALGLALLALVYFFPPVHGVHRWLRLGWVSLQPSELAKVAFVLALARYLMYRESYRRVGGLWVPLVMALTPLVLILREPDLGTAMVFLPLLFGMMYVAGARGADLVKVALCGVAVAPLLWTQMSREQRSRVSALFDQHAPGQRPGADGYQLHQAKQLLAIGGPAGTLSSGAAIDDRAAVHLPESHTDFILAVVGERFGWLGIGAALGLYALLVGQSLRIAGQTREPFGRLVAAGVATLVGVQAVINSGMAVGLLPVTGLPLPLMSYGGSGLVAHALALGLVLNVSLRPGYEVAREPFRFAA